MLGFQGYSQGQQNRRLSRTGSTPGGEPISYSFPDESAYKAKTMKRECVHVKKNIAAHITWLRVLSILFLIYFCYKEVLPHTVRTHAILKVGATRSAEPVSQVTPVAKWEEMEKNASEIAGKMTALQREFADLAKGLRGRVEALEHRVTGSRAEELIDTSSVATTLLESALRSIDLRYAPCAWPGCKHDSFVDVVAKLSKDYATKHTALTVVQLGFCVDHFLWKTTREMKGSISRFDVLDAFSERSPASNQSCVSSTGKRRGDAASVRTQAETLARQVSNETGITVKIVPHENFAYNEKSIDILILDVTNEAGLKTIQSTLKMWMKKVKVGGLIIGHSLAVVRPFEIGRGVDVTWNKLPVSPFEVAATREAVHAFIQKDKADLKVLLAGDTTWYITKKKLRLSDLFKP